MLYLIFLLVCSCVRHTYSTSYVNENVAFVIKAYRSRVWTYQVNVVVSYCLLSEGLFKGRYHTSFCR